MSEQRRRMELAAAYRLAARLGRQEAVANHFSLAVSEDGKSFLMNRRWRDFSAIRASESLLDAGETQLPADIDVTV